MIDLPPYVKAYADELVDAAPPFSPAQERVIQQILLPVIREMAAQDMAEQAAATG